MHVTKIAAITIVALAFAAPSRARADAVTTAQQVVSALEEAKGAVSAKLAEVDENDTMRKRCVSSKLEQIDKLITAARGSIEKMQLAIQDGKDDQAEIERENIETARSKADNYVLEADQCTGTLSFDDSSSEGEGEGDGEVQRGEVADASGDAGAQQAGQRGSGSSSGAPAMVYRAPPNAPPPVATPRN